MKTLHWFAIVTLVAGASLIACGSDDDDGSGGTSGTGGTAGSGGTGGTGGTGGASGTGGGDAGSAGTAGAAGGTAGAAGGTAGTAGTAGAAGGGSSACVAQCIEDNPTEWQALIDAVAPCVCQAGRCDTVCADSYCANPIDYDATDECLSCGLEQGQSNCMADLGSCAGTTCKNIVPCLLGCK